MVLQKPGSGAVLLGEQLERPAQRGRAAVAELAERLRQGQPRPDGGGEVVDGVRPHVAQLGTTLPGAVADQADGGVRGERAEGQRDRHHPGQREERQADDRPHTGAGREQLPWGHRLDARRGDQVA